ncbi:MAG: hypothetical protein JO246_02910 [Frankiaceae bacterium]|nr:hypothetical protein [Frankiaceae bacterium]MBV9871598.1 hypothetical protein [Frankiaceae bacterium]
MTDGGWLPPRGLLLHIGPHKTGTTAIQQAMANARPALRRHGVVYPGDGGQHRMPALAITGTRGVVGLRPPRIAEWDLLIKDVVAARRRRVVVSAEAFVEADDATAQRIVADLGGERVRVVITLRPLAKILPSAWQQMVRNRLRSTYDEWLDDVFNRPTERRQIANFWHRHHHDEVLDRWLSIVGPDRIAVVVADDVDRLVLPRSFESLLGLPEGLLVAPDVRDNRGLTAAEIELVRQVNVAFHERGWSSELYHRVVRAGGIVGMQTRTPSADEARIVTPAWAVERANEIAKVAAEHIRGSGALVLGDLDTLSGVVANGQGSGPAVAELPVAAAEQTLAGVRRQIALIKAPPPPEGGARPVGSMTLGELVGAVAERGRRRLSASLGLGIHRD